MDFHGHEAHNKRYHLPAARNDSQGHVPLRHDIRRCVAKIAFNYLAYVLLEDVRLLLGEDFDAVRDFVRHGTLAEHTIVAAIGGPRLTQESRKGSLVEGHMLDIGWSKNESILCNLSIFSAMTYQVALCRNYKDQVCPKQRAFL